MKKKSLTDRVIRQIKKPGTYYDGNGLKLQVTKNANTGAINRSWLVRFRIRGGKEREMGLGSFKLLGLADARAKAVDIQKAAREGLDPVAIRDSKIIERMETSKRTFRQCAKEYIALHKAKWSNDKHEAQWSSTLERYVFPHFGDVAIDGVDVQHVTGALSPIWTMKTETASRVRQRVEAILSWAGAMGYRSKENPARWKGHLEYVYPARGEARKVQHHPALPVDEVPSFMKALRARRAVGALAFEFCILTATRTSETLLAQWHEIDCDKALWTIPAERMKSKREHRIPLAPRALEILKRVQKISGNGCYVFPGQGDDEPLSTGVFTATLKRMERDEITAHGFRSSFRDWVAEHTEFQNEVAELALAHVIKNKSEASYRRGDMLDRRRPLMMAWDAYCRSADHQAANDDEPQDTSKVAS